VVYFSHLKQIFYGQENHHLQHANLPLLPHDKGLPYGKGNSFHHYNVASDLEKRQEMIARSGQMGVPVIFIDDEMIVGFDKDKIVSTLGISE